MNIQNNRLLLLLTGAWSVLFIPFVAMQFTQEVSWKIFDFVLMGILLSGLALAIEFILGTFRRPTQRVVFGGVALVIFLLVWAELAVGIFGTPFAGS